MKFIKEWWPVLFAIVVLFISATLIKYDPSAQELLAKPVHEMTVGEAFGFGVILTMIARWFK